MRHWVSVSRPWCFLLVGLVVCNAWHPVLLETGCGDYTRVGEEKGEIPLISARAFQDFRKPSPPTLLPKGFSNPARRKLPATRPTPSQQLFVPNRPGNG